MKPPKIHPPYLREEGLRQQAVGSPKPINLSKSEIVNISYIANGRTVGKKMGGNPCHPRDGSARNEKDKKRKSGTLSLEKSREKRGKGERKLSCFILLPEKNAPKGARERVSVE